MAEQGNLQGLRGLQGLKSFKPIQTEVPNIHRSSRQEIA